jgi:5'-3' exonuclease
MVLNRIQEINFKYRNEYGELVLAADFGSWRGKYFPYYKVRRKAAKASTQYIDWDKVKVLVNQIMIELKETFPYRVVQVADAEGDDVIGTLARYISARGEKVLIISRDKDFKQLHGPLVKQYSVIDGKWITVPDPKEDLFVMICKGDSVDDIPNALSPDDVFVRPDKKQGKMTVKRIEEIRCGQMSQEVERNFARNKTLIDLSCCPSEIQDAIIEAYEAGPQGERKLILPYMIKHNLRFLTEFLPNF